MNHTITTNCEQKKSYYGIFMWYFFAPLLAFLTLVVLFILQKFLKLAFLENHPNFILSLSVAIFFLVNMFIVEEEILNMFCICCFLLFGLYNISKISFMSIINLEDTLIKTIIFSIAALFLFGLGQFVIVFSSMVSYYVLGFLLFVIMLFSGIILQKQEKNNF